MTIKMNDVQRLGILRADAELRAVTFRKALLKERLGRLLDKIDPAGEVMRLLGEIDKTTKDTQQWEDKYKLEMSAVGAALGMDLYACTFDDETGEVSLVECDLPEVDLAKE